jgi:3-dehydroquinate dehydratase I
MKPSRRQAAGKSSVAIGGLPLGVIPRVVLAISGDGPWLATAADNGVDILEVRVDQLRQHAIGAVTATVKRVKRYGLPIIGTVRSKSEGGARRLGGSQRASLYDAISPLVDAIDTELSSVAELEGCIARARGRGNTIILSYHNFSATPSIKELETIVERAGDNGADIIKIATQAVDSSDVMKMLRFTESHKHRNLVTITMGAVGSLSRLVFPAAGSLMTYTNLSPANGQIPLDMLVDHLRFYYPAYNQELIGRLQLLEYA